MFKKLFSFLAGAGMVIWVSGCAEAPVKVGEGKIEPALHDVTGLAADAADNAAQKSQLNLMDVYALAAKRTEALASSAESVLQAKSQNAQALGAALPQIAVNANKTWISSSYIGAGTPNTLFNPASDTAYLSASETQA